MSEQRESFWMKYSESCLRERLCPSKYVIKHCRGKELACPVEAIRREHWKHLLNALSTDNTLSKVHFASCVWPNNQEDDMAKRNRRDKPFPTPYGRCEENIRDISVSLAGMLRTSQTLVILKLENLSLTVLDVEQIAIGLAESCYVKLLSFSGCKFEPGCVKALCHGLMKSCVTWLDLSCCALTQLDIEEIGGLIKFHSIRRATDMFPDTLRFSFPCFEYYVGLNRISLNNNYIEDEGIYYLVENMLDDNFIKALDLQNCGIENQAAVALLRLAVANQSLEVIDLRLNVVDKGILMQLSEQLKLNKAGKTYTHEYTPLWTPSEMIINYNNIGKIKIPKKPVYKFRFVKTTPKSSNGHQTSPVSRRRNNNLKDSCVQTTNDFTEVPVKVENFMEDLRKRYNNEMKLRKFFMNKYKMLKEENLQLRSFLRGETDNIYIDQETYFDIKHTFEKLKIFFDVMKKYGLWEYISMLGFDETTDVIIKESDAHKSVKVTRRDSPMFAEDVQDSKLRQEEMRQEACCICRKVDSKHCHVESPSGLPPETQNCANASSKVQCSSSKIAKTEDSLNAKIAYKLLEDVMNDCYEVHSGKTVPGKKSNLPQDNAKPCSSKQCGSSVPSASTGAHMLIKKFSYSNMPKKFKELVTPADFYDIVKKELERCENASGKPTTSHAEASSQTPSHLAPIKVRTEVSAPNHSKVITTVNQLNEIAKMKMLSRNTKPVTEPPYDDDFENMTISELIKKESAKQKKKSPQCIKQRKDDLDGAREEVSKSHKAPVMPKSHKIVLPKSKLKHSSSSQTGYEMSVPVLPKHNTSSDEINSSDSVVTTSNKFSSSSASSSSSNKSNVKSVSSHNEKEPQKSYLESVSDASTFRDVESIVETEVLQIASEESKLKDKNASMAKTLKSKSNSSSSSTLRKGPKSDKKPAVAVPTEISLENVSNKSNKSTKSDTAVQVKIKSISKQSNKSRPKSNSSKSSSVPSLSDITTVGSGSLNTDSVMKKISLSEDTSKGGN